MAVSAGACAEQAAEAPPGRVATVGPHALTVERLADFLVLAQPFPLDSADVADFARHWMGVAAFVAAHEAGRDLEGEEAVEAATWHDRREALLRAARAEEGADPPARPDSLYRDGPYRMVAHVLRRVGPETSRREAELQRTTAERIVADLAAGGRWADAVARSEDPETRDRGGLLGLFERGELPPALDRAAFSLAPGHVSSVLRTDAGFHVLYRPAWTDVQRIFPGAVAEREARRAAERAVARRLEALDGRPASGAEDRIRAMARAPADHFAGGEPVFVWDGGGVGGGVVARYLAGLPAPARAGLVGAPDGEVRAFLRDVAVRELELAGARARGVEVAPGVLEELEAGHREDLRRWRATLQLDADGPIPGAEVLDRYLDAVAARRGGPVTLPPVLEAWLMRDLEAELVPAGVTAAADRARALLAAAASAGAGDGRR